MSKIEERYSTLHPKLDNAVAFLRSLPTSKINVTAIHPDNRKIIGRTFEKADAAQLKKWLRRAQRRDFGVYFNINELGRELTPRNPKAGEDEVSILHAFHCDAEPDKTLRGDEFEKAKGALLELIRSAAKPPQLIINSGNGFAFWFPKVPVIVTDANRAELKARNIALRNQFQGDNCQDLCHVMRVPHTVNFPNHVKRERGRTTVLSSVVADFRGNFEYELDDFPPAALQTEASRHANDPKVGARGPKGLEYEQIGSPPIPEHVDLSRITDPDLRQLMATGGNLQKGERSELVFGVACRLRRDYDCSDGEIIAIIGNGEYGISAHIRDQKQREWQVQAARVIQGMNRESVKFRPTVKVAPSFIPQAIDQVEKTLLAEAKHDPNVADRIFQRDGRLVRLSRNLLPVGVTLDKQYREHRALVILPVTHKWLANRLDRSVQFVGPSAGNPTKKADKNKLVPKNASAEVVARMIEDNTHWRHPALFSTIEAPTLRADCSLLSKPGYDAATGIFYDPGETVFPTIEDKPTREQGEAAMQLIEDVLCDFPFADAHGFEGVSKSVALAMIMTGPVRRTLSIAPAFGIDANEPQSGKTELAKLAGTITAGRAIGVRPFTTDPEEQRKSIGTFLLEGRPVLIFDNVKNGGLIEGVALDMALTAEIFDDRRLGGHEGFTAPTNALFIITGNKLRAATDTATRLLVTRIVPTQKLADRKFTHGDLQAYALRRRPQLIAAVLTALRAYIVQGMPSLPERKTFRFAGWSQLIAGALEWYGYANPERGGDALIAEDPVREPQRDVVKEWWQCFGTGFVTSQQLYSGSDVIRIVAAALGKQQNSLNVYQVSTYIRGLVDIDLELDFKVRAVAPRWKGDATKWRLERVHGEVDPLD